MASLISGGQGSKLLLAITILLLMSFPASAMAGDVKVLIDDKPEAGQKIRQLSEELLSELEAVNNANLDTTLTVHVYRDIKTYQTEAPKNAVGYAIPALAEIHIRQDAQFFPVVLAHEISHVVFLRTIPDSSIVPKWFVEGLAVYQSKPSLESYEYQRNALASDLSNFKKLDLTQDSGLAASQGYVAVSFIADEFGQEGLRAVLDQLKAGTEFRSALEQGLGADYDSIERGWSGYTAHQRRIFDLVLLRDIGLIMIGILALITPIVWRLRTIRRMAGLDDEGTGEPDSGVDDVEVEVEDEA